MCLLHVWLHIQPMYNDPLDFSFWPWPFLELSQHTFHIYKVNLLCSPFSSSEIRKRKDCLSWCNQMVSFKTAVFAALAQLNGTKICQNYQHFTLYLPFEVKWQIVFSLLFCWGVFTVVYSKYMQSPFCMHAVSILICFKLHQCTLF